MTSKIAELIGQSGRRYIIRRVLQEKGDPPCRVYLATAGKERFVLKDVSQSEFKYLRGIHRSLRSSPYVRLIQDTIPARSIFVSKYFTNHLLTLAQKDLPQSLTKRILKDTLQGIAALHDQDIVHTDIKADNILINWREENRKTIIDQVQLGDIEDAAHVPPGSDIVGKQVGNRMWRSPEAHAQGRVNKPSDMFSFGIVCIYAVLKLVIFAVDDEELEEGMEPLSLILERQIYYFADADGLDGLLNHLGDSPWSEVFRVLRDGFGVANPRKPISLWKDMDPDFKHLIGGLTNFDPARRLTAHEALGHRWFGNP